ncbi:MAG TPA: C39 family peptidase [bacterium]|nr:C39 family peptidase [bacterium]
MRRIYTHYIPISLIIIGVFFGGLIYYESHYSTTDFEGSDSNSVTDNIHNEQAPENRVTNVPDQKTPEIKINFINHSVPFVVQAPMGDWDDERQQDGCEEASALMAMGWVNEKKFSKDEALKEILAISNFEQKSHGEFRDISLNDSRDWIFKEYFKYNNIEVKMNITASDIIKALHDGGVVILPMNGQKLGNPYFSGAGPERHMLLVRGYDPIKKQFITNDPGTKRGENYRYSESTIMNSILVYPTGYHEPTDESLKGMIVVKK